MLAAVYLTFYAGIAAYLCAAATALVYLRTADARTLRASSRALLAGAAMFVAMLAFRWATWQHLPLTTMTDSLVLFAVLAAMAILVTVRTPNTQVLLSFYLPPLALICLVNALVAHRFLPMEPRALRSSFLAVHVGLAVFAYALFYLASMTSAAYLCQAAHLKNHRMSWLVRHIPSLADLDAALIRLVRYGYPLFMATLALGLVWAFIDRDLLGPFWWASPKVVLSCVMAAFYAILFHLRCAGRLRGPKLAELVFIGFFVLIASYVVLSILDLRGYSFWNDPS
ncbi:MAG TPA: cytochrome c biogenesis protein CcsA [Candidatus Hydrogenedentes bacterium]|nr:cytochrome c biogenesis protein CcsA [Candidatus Hydrogenedentota bacterium]HPG67467.1 cytochrome c biogenesis protein CcsA [Candidatus Hydrogenedentota bacterium]